MRITRWTTAALALLAAAALAGDLEPPKPPERDKKALESASAVAADVARIVAYMESGQAYYKAYARGSHTTAENKAFVRFAEDYDSELNNLKRELEVLRVWVDKKAELKPE